ncbi:hypothetical protein MHYP_G00325480 [Metynnis hypsauchen]
MYMLIMQRERDLYEELESFTSDRSPHIIACPVEEGVAERGRGQRQRRKGEKRNKSCLPEEPSHAELLRHTHVQRELSPPAAAAERESERACHSSGVYGTMAPVRDGVALH